MNLSQEQQLATGHATFPGSRLHNGEYLVQRVLGTGGMGTVYLATHTILATPLALKQVPADQPLPESVRAELDYILQGGDVSRRFATDVPYGYFPASGGEHTDRFLREALLLARLHHPAIPTLYDYFYEDGFWYLVMDYVPAPTLHAYLRQYTSLHTLLALDYAMQLCDVLDYLHKCVPPISFRDLKPSNILLLLDGSLMLVDFGIAHYLQTDGMQATLPLDLGSPGYAPPEQYASEAQPDLRSDLYSLGVVLYEMVSGQHPTQVDLPLLSCSQTHPDISTAVSGLIQLATQSDPALRFQSAHTFYLALERVYHLQELYVHQNPLLTTSTHSISTTIAAIMNGVDSPEIISSHLQDMEQRRRMREALQLARQERLEQERLESQLVLVDESLRQRSSIPLSQQPQLSQGREEGTHVVTQHLNVYRLIQICFLLALVLCAIMVSLLLYMHVGYHAPISQPGHNQHNYNVSRRAASIAPVKHPTPSASNAGLTWQPLPSLVAPQADNTAVYVSVHGRAYIYMSGGYSSSTPTVTYSHNLYRYDIAAAQWETLSGNGFPGMVNNAAVVDHEGDIFFTAGYSSDTYTVNSLLYKYQSATGTVQKITPPTSISLGFGGSILLVQQGGLESLYISQGFLQAGNPVARAGSGWFRYDIASDQWHALATMPVGLGYVVLTTTQQHDLLLLGGSLDAQQYQPQSTIYRYHVATNSWTLESATLPQALSGMASCMALSGATVIIGGYDQQHNQGSNQTWLFNQQTLQWRAMPALPHGGSILGSAACDGAGHVFLIRGASDPRLPTADFWEFVIPSALNSTVLSR